MMIDFPSEILPRPEETFNEYRLRIYYDKALGKLEYNWTDISKLFETAFGVKKSESTWRKESKRLLKMNGKKSTENVSKEDPKDSLKSLILEFEKERVKVRDERTQLNAFIRTLAREDTLKEIAHEVVDKMDNKKLLSTPTTITKIHSTNKEAIIQISDWHYGMEFENYLNVFNPEICKERVSKFLEECEIFLTQHPVKKIYVTNLGDLIAGRIHSQIRIQSRYNVIEQIMHVSEILAEFLNDLSAYAPIEYYDCLDNHSRIEPNKKESLDLESLALFISWYLKERLINNTKIHINDNLIDKDIISFKVCDGKYNIGAVHGHKDKQNKVIEGLTLLTKNYFDLILTAHEHHFSCNEKNNTLLISNGSLMGTDTYSFDLRLSSNPSQNIVLIGEKSVAEDIHRIILN